MKIVVIILFALGFATGINLNFNSSAIFTPEYVVKSFTKDFSGASEVSWKRESNYLVASFQFNELPVKAFYTAEGVLIGTAKKVEAGTVPSHILDYIDHSQGQPVPSEIFLYTDIDPFDNVYLPKTRNTPTVYLVKLYVPGKELNAVFTPNRKAYNITIPGF